MITLHIEPRVVRTWEQFLAHAPPFSIALDGYVRGGPRFDRNGPYVNYNHHEEVDRLGTRSTCAQVYIAIKQGVLDKFSKDGAPHANLYVNDPDQDTCVAVWLLQNNERLQKTRSEPLINKLMVNEDFLDTTAGAYPIELTSPLMRQLAWIFEPYTDARTAGRLPYMDAAAMRDVIEAVGQRISSYTMGKCKQINPDTRHELIGGGKDWALIKELGAYARCELFRNGKKAFVSVHDRGDGTYTYAIGKMSPYVEFSVQQLYDDLNGAENLKNGDANSWGGSDISGGSPRMTGSRLKPQDVERIINKRLGAKQ